MMRYILFLFVIIDSASCRTAFKEGVSGKIAASAIKKIAILPFTVSPDTNRLLNGVTAESILRSAKISRYRFQQYLYIWFIKNPKKYNVTFQEFMTTNNLLKQADFTDSTQVKTKEQLCFLLNVDAVIFGDMHFVKPMSEEGSDLINGIIGLPVTASYKVNLALSMYESTGNLKWKRTYVGRGNVGDESIIGTLMRRVSNTFPY